MVYCAQPIFFEGLGLPSSYQSGCNLAPQVIDRRLRVAWAGLFWQLISTDLRVMSESARDTSLSLLTVCDFCNRGSFIKAYACHAFVYLKGTPMEHYRYEEWAACADCATLIDAGQWDKLAERTVQAFVKQHRTAPRDVPTLREHVSNQHSAFRQYLIPEA